MHIWTIGKKVPIFIHNKKVEVIGVGKSKGKIMTQAVGANETKEWEQRGNIQKQFHRVSLVAGRRWKGPLSVIYLVSNNTNHQESIIKVSLKGSNEEISFRSFKVRDK